MARAIIILKHSRRLNSMDSIRRVVTTRILISDKPTYMSCCKEDLESNLWSDSFLCGGQIVLIVRSHDFWMIFSHSLQTVVVRMSTKTYGFEAMAFFN